MERAAVTTQSGSKSRAAVPGHNVFGEDVAAYRDGRPGYPDALFELLVDSCKIGDKSDVLEIGPGTRGTRVQADLPID